ncbi:MAG: HD domain-containing protein [Candidatus Andersenbacteria bacterium]
MATVVAAPTKLLTIDKLVTTALAHDPRVDEATLREAYAFAEEAHANQTRATGEPYIQHPMRVAQTIASLRLGTTAIVAALLHDVREDTAPHYYEQIGPRFGEAVNFLVEGVTRLSKVKKLRAGQGSVEDLRNIFLAMSRDIRVIIIKLADRLHNLQTLYGLPSPKQHDVALQTLDIYAPIADRLGMGEIKGQLEDLAFEYLHPDTAAGLRERVRGAYEERVRYCDEFQHELQQELAAKGLRVLDIHGRAKRLYSLHLKLERYHDDISQIYDLVAVRVVLPTLSDCYKALGIVHARWRPLVGKIKDYVATPKANGYQSIHTTVITGEGRFVEVQIRTADMHALAERGVAAAWAYADAKRSSDQGGGLEAQVAGAAALASPHDVAWVQQLATWQQEVDNPEEFFQTLRTDFFRNRIFCLTPAGEVVNLPEAATPIDFAYAVHTMLGHRAVGAASTARSGRSTTTSPAVTWSRSCLTSGARAAPRVARLC